MFKFLFGKKDQKVVIETQRETVVRTVDELNAVLALMGDKPKIGIDLNSGALTIDLPDQMPDEALALPAPEDKTEMEKTANDAVEKAKDAAEVVGEKTAGDKVTA